mgnify:CR=1 FL=1
MKKADRSRYRGLFALAGCAILILSLSACRTTRREGKTPEKAAVPMEFQPAAYVAPIQLAHGRYTDIFSPDSYGVWLGSEVTAQREIQARSEGAPPDPKLAMAVNRLTQNFLVFECHLVSAFADTSIAYDAVGLRNIAVYLMTPAGGRCMPSQIVVGSSAREERQQALRQYSRTCLVLFAKRDLFSGVPAVAPQSTSVRLVLEGFGSMFVMEWPTASEAVPFATAGPDTSKALRTRFKEMGDLAMRISHIFD